jgi:hypothetical protein
MPCELEKEHVETFPGLTLFSKPGSNCIKPTGVYLPVKHVDTKNALDVVLWLHGWYVTSHKQLFHSDEARVRQQVLNSSKDVVLIAPFLGKRFTKEDPGTYDVSDLKKAKWGERYLSEILTALARFQNPNSPPKLDIKNLAIACHSGGGAGMRNLVGTLGKFQPKLKECWGFDCLYGENSVPDDATFWFQWMLGMDARPLHIVYGPSTLPQSVKLDLIGRGKATPKGNKADPPGPKISDLHVSIGHYEAFPVMGQIVNIKNIDALVDDLMTRPPPSPPKGTRPTKPTKPKDGDFVKQAAKNLSANFAFVFDIHYFIARSGFLSRLRNAGFLV